MLNSARPHLPPALSSAVTSALTPALSPAVDPVCFLFRFYFPQRAAPLIIAPQSKLALKLHS